MKFPVGYNPKLHLLLNGEDFGPLFKHFEWKSFTNGGYIIRGTIHDSYYNKLRNMVRTFYLQKGRREPTKITFELEWPGVSGDNNRTGKHIAFITDLDARGVAASGVLEFVAVDPPSYWLNAGDCSGAMFEGSVKEVIEQVAQKYFIGPNGPYGGGKVEVSKTLDFNKNRWWMMRQDPKTFIASLLEWSSSVNKNKTHWIVSSSGSVDEEPTIQIKESAVKETKNYGQFSFNVKTPAGNTVYNIEFLADNFISAFQTQLITQGISTVSERYLDRRVDKDRKIVHVYDENTAEKKNVDISEKKGFKKPDHAPTAFEKPHEWSTSVIAIPELNAGDMGLSYDKYIDGRARGLFLNMLNLTMRIKIRCTGIAIKDLANSHNLGVSKLRLLWRDPENEEYFLDGDWLVYGFHHIVAPGKWYTDLYCARLDFDAAAKKV